MKIMVIGNVGFDLMAPYLSARGVTTVLVGISSETRYAALADAFYSYECEDWAPLVSLALSHNVEGVISISGPDHLNLRDSHVKTVLESDHSIPVLANPLGAVVIAADKAKTKRWLAERGFPTPAGRLLEDERDASDIARQLGFPLVIKKPGLSGGLGMNVAVSMEQFREAVQGRCPILVEKQVGGPEFSVEVLNFGGKAVAMPPVYKGATSAQGTHPVDRVRLAPAPIDARDSATLRRLAKTIVAELDLQPTADVDIVWTDQGPQVLEINPRFGGVTALSMGSSGIPVYRSLVDMALGNWASKRIRKRPAYAADLPIAPGTPISLLSSIIACDGVFRIKLQKRTGSDGRIALKAERAEKLLSLARRIADTAATDRASCNELEYLVRLSSQP